MGLVLLVLVAACGNEASYLELEECERIDIERLVVVEDNQLYSIHNDMVFDHPECTNAVLGHFGIDNVAVSSPSEFASALSARSHSVGNASSCDRN